MSAERKTVLLVDDDAQFLEMLQSLLRAASEDAWEVLASQTTAMALTLLQTHRVDLAVIDLRMPVIDGVQFIQLVSPKYPHVRKVLLSGFLDNAFRASAGSAGADLVLEKPVTPEGFQNVIAALAELLRWHSSEEGFRGVLRRVVIEDVIQMECLSRHSLVLEVSSADLRGSIFIRKGELVHAECGGIEGEPALQQLLSLGGGEFQHGAYTDPPHRTLHGSWEFLLMEAVRKRDEAAGEEAAAPAGEELPSESEPPMPPVSEMVVCSLNGEILHAWQSTSAQQQCAMLMALQGMSARVEKLLPVGSLERVEFFGQRERVVARLSSQGAVLVRGTVNPV